jgi:hypothetical protein
MMKDEQLKGKDFEACVKHRADYDEKHGMYTLGRYGVKANLIEGQWVPMQSLPDFEGIVPPEGWQFIFDAKACSQASYDLSGSTHKSFKHQLKHMRRRAKFGAVCFVLIHFNRRVLKTKSDPALTVAFPIYESPFWLAYDAGDVKRVNRNEAVDMGGVEVEWNIPSNRSRRETPDVFAAVLELRERQIG